VFGHLARQAQQTAAKFNEVPQQPAMCKSKDVCYNGRKSAKTFFFVSYMYADLGNLHTVTIVKRYKYMDKIQDI
jgi:hypothetical protein